MKKLLKWLNEHQGFFIAAGGIAIIVFSLVTGDWFVRCLVLMILFFFLLGSLF